MSSPYQQALDAGYSEEEIQSYLSKKNPKFQQAIDAGYKPEEITVYLKQKEKPKEGLGSNIGRQVARGVARTAETVLGAPRAFGEFLEGLMPEQALKKGAEKIGLRGPAEKGIEFTKKYAPYKLLPKSEDIRENVTKNLFGEKLEPKNEWEKKADDFVSDFAALAIPFPGSQFKLLKPGLLAAGGNIASEIIGRIGGSEKEKTYAKLGTILVGSMINPRSAEKLKNELYTQAREARPADAKVTAKNLEKQTNDFEKQLMKGDPSAGSKKKSVSLLNDIKSKIKNNEIDVGELEQFKIDVNEARSGLYEEFKTDKVGRKTAKRNLDQVSKIIDNGLKDYGKTNPEWEAFYRPANEVHGAIAQSQKARYFIQKQAKKYGHHAILPLLGLGHFAGPGATIEGAAITGALGTGAVIGGEIAAKFAKSPTLRKHYMNLVNSALKEDIVATRENLKKLEDELEND